jgi:hypothetical protein
MEDSPLVPPTDSDMSHLLKAGFTFDALEKKVSDARMFHERFLAAANCDEAGLHISHMPEWGRKYIRRSGSVPQAVLEKLGSNSFCKRRPEDPKPFLDYIKKRHDQGAFLHLRLVVGPVKNARQYGDCQEPDLAEYLMLMQLARLMGAIAPLYPYGIKVQMMPDDMRGRIANGWPDAYSIRYISGLRRLARQLRFQGWLEVEEGQARLYDVYHVKTFLQEAREEVIDDPNYSVNLTKACLRARENFVAQGQAEVSASAVRDSAMRYLVCYEAEILSGMWSPEDTLPLTYAWHSGNYQLYTMGPGRTKLPWQIRLPFDSVRLEEQALSLPRIDDSSLMCRDDEKMAS